MDYKDWLPYPDYEPVIKGVYLVTVVADWGKGKVRQITLARWNDSDQCFSMVNTFRKLHDVKAFMCTPNPYLGDSKMQSKKYRCNRCNGSGKAWITSKFGNKRRIKCPKCDGYGYVETTP
jgi:DnaJ-class molecular chaperone